MRPRKFLLVGHAGSYNRGCEALVRTTVDIVQSYFSGATFVLSSHSPETDGPLCDIPGLRIIPETQRRLTASSPTRGGRSGSLRQLVKAAVPHGAVLGIRRWRESKTRVASTASNASLQSLELLSDAIMEADAVIAIGGDNYTEDYAPPTWHMDVLEYAQYLGRKTVIWGASIGPFRTEWLRQRMVALLGRVSLITVREPITFEYLAGLGITNNTRSVADPAFLMKPILNRRTLLPWDAKPDRIIGFNGSGFLHKYLERPRASAALDHLVAFFQGLIDTQSCRVILVPHASKPSSPFSDFYFLSEFRRRLQRDDSVYLLPPGLDARETKGVIAQCDYFFGMRMHATIAALSEGIPTIGLYYSAKSEGLFHSFYGHKDYLIPYQAISTPNLSLVFSKLQAEQASARALLGKRAEEVREQARLAGHYLRDMLGCGEHKA